MKTLEEGDPGASTGKGLRCYRQRQEFLPPFEMPQCYLIVGKAPPGSGRLCPGGVLVPCFGKHGWAWDTWQWLWGDPGTTSCVRKPFAPAWDLTGLGHVCLGCGTARRGVQATQCPPSAPESHSRVLSPLRASTALDKAPQAPKAVSVSHLRIPGGHLRQEHPSTALGSQPSKHGSLPQSTEIRVSRLCKLKMQSRITCKLDTSHAGKAPWPSRPSCGRSCPGWAVARGMPGEQGLVCTGCASWICCDTTSRSLVFIWFLYNFSPEQTPDQSSSRSQKQSGREHDRGHWTVSDVTKQWGVPSPRSRASQTQVILGCLGTCCQTHTSV